MGKDFILIKKNSFDLKKTYDKLFNGFFEITESSEISLIFPNFKDVVEIEIGTDNTKESILRLNNNGFVVVNKTIPIKELK